ncbi:hypothetical protein [Baekduia alba]|uniref:hypothetical protein n=1 Tax=Baekduia alba TaxID=2997333 RepID=UPI002340D966|nr:hypothetical protein [Baekduia alba]
MTADNQPLLGPADDVEGLWVAEALWVTHAAGAARALVKTMLDMPPAIGGLGALRPGRFGGRRHDELMRASHCWRQRDAGAVRRVDEGVGAHRACIVAARRCRRG